MTLSEFADLFALLAVQLRHTDADEVVIRAYYEGLQDIEVEWLRAAADRLSRQATWFPKTSEWRAAAEAIRRHRIDSQQPSCGRPWPLCHVCGDTSWAPIDSVEHGRAVRRVTPCACRAQRRREILGQIDRRRSRRPDPTIESLRAT